MPKRKLALRSQPTPQTSRKKSKQRSPKPPPPPIVFSPKSVALTEDAPPTEIAVPRAAPASRLPGRDYAYVKRELQRIAMTATLIIVLLVILSILIR